MYYELYIDVFAAENFLMDSLLLALVGWILKEKRNPVRILASGALGSAGSCIPVFVPAWRFGPAAAALAFLFGGAMVVTAFGFSGKKRFLKTLLALFSLACLLEGVLRILLTQTTLPVILAAALGILLVCAAFRLWDRLRAGEQHRFRVTLLLGERKLCLTALRDTGNQLYEPIRGRPVSVGNYDILSRLLAWDTPVFLIPYHTVGRSRGLLPGFLADRMIIQRAGEREITVDYPVLALTREPVSRRADYELLLHPDLTEQP